MQQQSHEHALVFRLAVTFIEYRLYYYVEKKKFLLNVKMNVNGKMELESRPYNFKKSCLKII